MTASSKESDGPATDTGRSPPEPAMTIEELARRQGIEPLVSIDALAPTEPLFDGDEHAAFLKWLEELRHSEVA